MPVVLPVLVEIVLLVRVEEDCVVEQLILEKGEALRGTASTENVFTWQENNVKVSQSEHGRWMFCRFMEPRLPHSWPLVAKAVVPCAHAGVAATVGGCQLCTPWCPHPSVPPIFVHLWGPSPPAPPAPSPLSPTGKNLGPAFENFAMYWKVVLIG